MMLVGSRRSAARRMCGGVALASLCACAGPGQLKIHVIDNVTAGNSVGGAQVHLLATTMGAITNAGGLAVLSVDPAGLYTVQAGAMGYCTNQVTVNVAAGGSTSLTLPLCPPDGDHVLVAGNSSPTPVLVLLDGDVTTGCWNDAFLQGSAGSPVGANAIPPPSPGVCSPSLYAFAAKNGPVRLAGTTALPWTSANTDVVTVQLPPSRTPLPIKFWISLDAAAGGPTDAEVISDLTTLHYPALQTILEANRTGIEVPAAPDITSIGTLATSPADDAALRSTIGHSCASARAIMAEPRIFDPARLNVYYTTSVLDPSGGGREGIFCYQQGAPGVLFVRANTAEAHMLAHEVGHALGLIEPWDGHTDQMPHIEGWMTNPMSYNVVGPTELTVGQVFRMSYSPYSWLNRPVGGSSPRADWLALVGAAPVAPVSCPCDPRMPSPPECPALEFNLTAPSAAPSYPYACSMTGLPPTLALSCPTAQLKTVNFMTTGGALPAYGEAATDIDNPAVVSVSIASATPKTATIKLTPHANGTANLTVYAGGPSASQRATVTVSGCP